MRNIIFTSYPDVISFIVIATDAPDSVIEEDMIEDNCGSSANDIIKYLNNLGYKAVEPIKIHAVYDHVNSDLSDCD